MSFVVRRAVFFQNLQILFTKHFLFCDALSGREYDLFHKFAGALALAYDGIRLSGVSNRLFPSERAFVA
jgi:hypothetical protein